MGYSLSPDSTILFCSAKPLYPAGQGGGEISAHFLMTALKEEGLHFEALGAYPAGERSSIQETLSTARGLENLFREGPGDEPIWCYQMDYPVSLYPLGQFVPACRRAMARQKIRSVFLQAEGWPEVAPIARAAGQRTVFFVRNGLELNGLSDLAERDLDLLVANSNFTRRKAAGLVSRPIITLYPLIPPASNPIPIPPGDRPFVTFINPIEDKGRDTFFALARELLDLPFLVVENWGVHPLTRKVLAAYPNVTLWPRQADMTRVWEKTRLLIVPSVWEEAFGRVVPEAQRYGIPVLASRRGGLPEATGTGGLLIDDFKNPRAWVETILAVLSQKEFYATLSGEAVQNAFRFSPERLLPPFLGHLKEWLGLDLGP